jgi:hypothetical protein
MDYPTPIKPKKDLYFTNFFKNSKSSFMSQINDICKDKEDPTQCAEKFSKGFETVFNTLNDQLVEEDKIYYILEKRMENGEGLCKNKQHPSPTGYEGMSS